MLWSLIMYLELGIMSTETIKCDYISNPVTVNVISQKYCRCVICVHLFANKFKLMIYFVYYVGQQTISRGLPE